MSETRYLKPPWWMRVIGNRISPVMGRSMVVRLSVPGRITGQWRTTPIVVLDHEGARYLIAPGGQTEWARNLRAARRARLIRGGRAEDIDAVEIPASQRPPLIAAYQDRFGKMPTVAAGFTQLPDPADHPTFRIYDRR